MPPRNGQQPAQRPVQNRGQGRREAVQPLNCEQRRILQWLRKVRFRKQIFGGVNERDVWKKIEELNAMYNTALVAERARYDALLEQQRWQYGYGAQQPGPFQGYDAPETDRQPAWEDGH